MFAYLALLEIEYIIEASSFVKLSKHVTWKLNSGPCKSSITEIYGYNQLWSHPATRWLMRHYITKYIYKNHAKIDHNMASVKYNQYTFNLKCQVCNRILLYYCKCATSKTIKGHQNQSTYASLEKPDWKQNKQLNPIAPQAHPPQKCSVMFGPEPSHSRVSAQQLQCHSSNCGNPCGFQG